LSDIALQHAQVIWSKNLTIAEIKWASTRWSRYNCKTSIGPHIRKGTTHGRNFQTSWVSVFLDQTTSLDFLDTMEFS